MARMTDDGWRKIADDLGVNPTEARRQVRRVLQALSAHAGCDCAAHAGAILDHAVGNEE